MVIKGELKKDTTLVKLCSHCITMAAGGEKPWAGYQLKFIKSSGRLMPAFLGMCLEMFKQSFHNGILPKSSIYILLEKAPVDTAILSLDAKK